MSRPKKIVLIVLGSIAGLLVVVVVGFIIVVQTQWFRGFVRGKIVAAIEDGTGGKAEIGAFSFDWTHLRADVRNLVIHGNEGPNEAPLFRAADVQVVLHLLSPFHGGIDIAYLGVDTPQANVIVYPDGHTNLPTPKVQHKSNKTGLETVVDLAVRRFDLHNGTLMFAGRKSDLNARGENLKAELAYNVMNPSYTGTLSMAPLYLRSGGNQPLNVNVNLPVTLEKDRITLTNAKIATPQSEILISGDMDHLVAPRTTARVNARIALAEVKQVAGTAVPLETGDGLPNVLTADVNAYMDDNRIDFRSAHLALGQSNVEASGTLKDDKGNGSLQFRASLALGEIGRLMRVAARPEGVLRAGGNATLGGNSEYRVTANVDGRGLAFREGSTRLSGINLDAAVYADPRLIELTGIRLAGLGGSFNGRASVENMQQFHVAGNLSHFDLQEVARAFTPQRLPYDGLVSGPVDATGSLKNMADIRGDAHLAIAPGPRGIPVSGSLNASYNGATDTVDLGRSYIALPNTRLELSGTLGRRVDVRLASRNLNDLAPAFNMGSAKPSPLPVSLNRGGAATFTGTIAGPLSAPHIAGHLDVNNFEMEGRPFTRLAADVQASPSGATLSQATITSGTTRMQLSGSLAMRNWKPVETGGLTANVSIQNADVRDLLALSGEKLPVTGTVSVDGRIHGSLSDPLGTLNITAVNGTAWDEPFQRIALSANLNEGRIDVPTIQVLAGSARLDGNLAYVHARQDLKRGTLTAHIATNTFSLAQFQTLVKDRPGLGGTAHLVADASVNLWPGKSGEEFQIVSANGDASAQGLRMQGRNYGDFTATARTSGPNLVYNVNSDFAGSTIRVSGQSLLAGNHDTTAHAAIANLPIQDVLAIAGRRDIPAAGLFSADANVAGTLQDPRASGAFSVVKGSAYGEAFDRLQTNLTYASRLIDVPSLVLSVGPNTIRASASFAHPAGDFDQGQLRFRIDSNTMQLATIHPVQQSKPGLAGALKVAADGAATLRKSGTPRLLFSTLNANLSATGLNINRKPLGDAVITADTHGTNLEFNLKSDFGGSNIQGGGTMVLAGDYPVKAQLSFNHVTYSGLTPWIGAVLRPGMDASVDGRVDVAGPVTRPEDLGGTLQLSRLEMHSVPAAGGPAVRRNISLHNSAPIVVTLNRSTMDIRSAHLVGPFMDLSVSGSASMAGAQSLNVRADGNVRLEMAEAFAANVFSSGNVVLHAAVQGTMAKPDVRGQLTLQNASLNVTDFPNGLSNANGTIAFNGTAAVIQNITGTSGGGQITLTGFVGYGGPEMQFRLEASVRGMHLEYPQDISTGLNARLDLTGSTSRSLLSGRVTILEVAMHSHTDIGSMLSQTAAPVSTPTEQTGLLGGMRFDVRIATAPDIQVRTTLAQNIALDAQLTLRGTANQPGMLGRVNITEGDVVFFGSKYTLDQGSIAFFNPHQIEPVLNIDLSTTVKGVDVNLTVAGPMDRMKLTYRSDPPLQFSEIVALLATGKVPTSDPVLAAHQPVAPQQNIEQIGASAVLGQAVANPVSGRLQRLFGVTKLKIDPQITGASNTPEARLTLQQQITPQLTFTYIQDVTQSNPQIIQVEWTIDPAWSLIAERDVNGEFGLDFFYKKRFH